ncbi:hypothetical protein BGZ99_009906 [Dissophora globulifera]|uniref:Uncharacterized protein n=1 Tax=Dissophora globulifera TaxID=979702 RepID=A0A9P6RUX9_9FUNG|nr:hypothetical protein BGZ99_009906 [Dissophora globulifera]
MASSPSSLASVQARKRFGRHPASVTETPTSASTMLTAAEDRAIQSAPVASNIVVQELEASRVPMAEISTAAASWQSTPATALVAAHDSLDSMTRQSQVGSGDNNHDSDSINSAIPVDPPPPYSSETKASEPYRHPLAAHLHPGPVSTGRRCKQQQQHHYHRYRCKLWLCSNNTEIGTETATEADLELHTIAKDTSSKDVNNDMNGGSSRLNGSRGGSEASTPPSEWTVATLETSNGSNTSGYERGADTGIVPQSQHDPSSMQPDKAQRVNPGQNQVGFSQRSVGAPLRVARRRTYSSPPTSTLLSPSILTPIRQLRRELNIWAITCFVLTPIIPRSLRDPSPSLPLPISPKPTVELRSSRHPQVLSDSRGDQDEGEYEVLLQADIERTDDHGMEPMQVAGQVLLKSESMFALKSRYRASDSTLLKLAKMALDPERLQSIIQYYRRRHTAAAMGHNDTADVNQNQEQETSTEGELAFVVRSSRLPTVRVGLYGTAQKRLWTSTGSVDLVHVETDVEVETDRGVLAVDEDEEMDVGMDTVVE